MKKILYFLVFILFVGNIYFLYSYNKVRDSLNSTQEQLKLIPHYITMEQVENLRLYYLKPKIFKAKLHAESGAFFQHIKKADENIHSKISCVLWTDDSKKIFYSLFKENNNLYESDNQYQKVLDGIDFFDSLCKRKKNDVLTIIQTGDVKDSQLK